jgi:hypothetical protein
MFGGCTAPPPEFSARTQHCDIHHSECAVQFSDGTTLQFSATPRPIPLLKPLQLSLNTSIDNIKEVRVRFVGINMTMPDIPYPMHSTTPGNFTGKGGLGICVFKRMEWEAEVAVTSSSGIYKAYFPFVTVRQ